MASSAFAEGKDVSDEAWFQIEADDATGATEFFSITESPEHVLLRDTDRFLGGEHERS